MSSSTRTVPATSGTILSPAGAAEARAKTRGRARMVAAGVTIMSFALLVDLLLVGHTLGEELWGPVTAAAGTLVGLLSLAYLVIGGRSKAARIVLYALWVLVAFFGFGGYNDHRLPRSADTIADQRERPPLAPLAFTGLAMAGALALRTGSKGA